MTLLLAMTVPLALAAPPPAAAFVPLPGYPSLVEGDLPGAALGAAIAVPGGLAFAMTGRAAGWGARQTIVAGAAGFYVCTVAANQLVPRLRGPAPLTLSPAVGAEGWGITAHLAIR